MCLIDSQNPPPFGNSNLTIFQRQKTLFINFLEVCLFEDPSKSSVFVRAEAEFLVRFQKFREFDV